MLASLSKHRICAVCPCERSSRRCTARRPLHLERCEIIYDPPFLLLLSPSKKGVLNKYLAGLNAFLTGTYNRHLTAALQPWTPLTTCTPTSIYCALLRHDGFCVDVSGEWCSSLPRPQAGEPRSRGLFVLSSALVFELADLSSGKGFPFGLLTFSKAKEG